MPSPLRLKRVFDVSLGQSLGQLRAVPVRLGGEKPEAVLLAYGADVTVDPYVEMFFFPRDTLKLALVSLDGEFLWRKDLGRGVVPGTWFCPVLAFDLDGDDVDEVWFVGNEDPEHPLGLSHYRLERLDARTGETTGRWPWPNLGGPQSPSHTFRNFIVGGHVHGEPVLVTAQGTYGDMFFQGWSTDMSPRWEHRVGKDDLGARGSHMCPVTDLDQDGVEELMWGERCIELDCGRELFCADRDTWRGHSDVVEPVLDEEEGRWYFFTCREGRQQVAPRMALYDARGNRVWGHLDHGHIDMGWVARLGDDRRKLAMGIRIGTKTLGPTAGLQHTGTEEFVYDALTGEEHPLAMSLYRTVPVDLNGDGYHELVRSGGENTGQVVDRDGSVLAELPGPISLASKFLDLPGEQVLTWTGEGSVQAWADAAAEDSPEAQARYQHPFYRTNQRLSASGTNLPVLGGL